MSTDLAPAHAPDLPAPVDSLARPDEHPALAYLAHLAPGSRPAMRGALDTIARMAGYADAAAMPWAQLRATHTGALRAQLAERYAPATANRHLSALRGVLREAWRRGQIGTDDYHRAVDLEAVKGAALAACETGRHLTAGELSALFAACAADPSPAGPRDAAMLALLYAAGLRRAEAVALDLADYNRDTGAVTIRAGKGGKARVAYATNGARAALDAWCAQRGDEPGALLCPVDKAGRVTVRRLTGKAVMYRLQRRAEQASVAAFSPHDLRRTFIGDLLDRGADIATVQGMAGHASVTTTARYDRRPARVRRQAAELLHVPYAGATSTS